MSRKAELERREGPSERRQETRFETRIPAQVVDQPDRREDPTKMPEQPRGLTGVVEGPAGEVVTELTHQRRPDMRTTQEIVTAQAEAAAKEVEEAGRRGQTRLDGPELLEVARVQEAAAAKQVDVQVDRLRRTAPDPWKHRGLGMRCSTCMWYVAKNGPANGAEIGRCRRRAPTMSGYPVVFPVDWCGDHKLSEVRV
jgi:hypothetical protein